jgi:hypothetical protein
MKPKVNLIFFHYVCFIYSAIIEYNHIAQYNMVISKITTKPVIVSQWDIRNLLLYPRDTDVFPRCFFLITSARRVRERSRPKTFHFHQYSSSVRIVN